MNKIRLFFTAVLLYVLIVFIVPVCTGQSNKDAVNVNELTPEQLVIYYYSSLSTGDLD
ncbi:MAG: hypothetical protein PHO01_01695 [Desulfotomaculaceae bacterium]|nr:hypothetical protein [Desulfotomaculaceae bacterium]